MSSVSKLLSRYRRIAVVGGPGSGKTTACAGLDGVIHTDLLGGEWGTIGARVVKMLAARQRWVVEGVHVIDALNAGLKPDVLVLMTQEHKQLNERQRALHRRARRVAASTRLPVVVPCACGGGVRCGRCMGVGWAPWGR